MEWPTDFLFCTKFTKYVVPELGQLGLFIFSQFDHKNEQLSTTVYLKYNLLEIIGEKESIF